MTVKTAFPLILVAGLLLLGLIAGCESKFDLTQLPDPGQPVAIGDTSYVELYPPWGGFSDPGAILVGNDQMIYVADYDRDEIVIMNAGGTTLARRVIPNLRPISLAQNSKLDLYIGGEVIASNGIDTVGAIYRIHLVRFDTTYISRIDTVINSSTGDTSVVITRRDTSYFYNHDLENAPARVVWQEQARPQRRFTGIGILPGNGYLVTRTGPDNSSFVDPDSRVLLFNEHDILQTPVGDLVTRASGGSAITDIKNLTGILVFPSSRDFIVTQNSEGTAYGAIWMTYFNTPDFQGWLPKFDPAKTEQRSIDFIRTNRFRNPSAIALDRRRREIFIVDSELDSVFKFNRNGQFKVESFGAHHTKTDAFPSGLDRPRGVAFSNDCTLYIADSGNKVIRRFKVSTQTACN